MITSKLYITAAERVNDLQRHCCTSISTAFDPAWEGYQGSNNPGLNAFLEYFTEYGDSYALNRDLEKCDKPYEVRTLCLCLMAAIAEDKTLFKDHKRSKFEDVRKNMEITPYFTDRYALESIHEYGWTKKGYIRACRSRKLNPFPNKGKNAF
jgi:hypothetical protein